MSKFSGQTGRSAIRSVIGDDPVLQAAYRLCRRRTRRQDPAQYTLIQLVPAMLRPACWALWAAANALDDLADDRDASAGERAVRVKAWIAALDRDLAVGASEDPVRHALVDTALRWRLDLSGLAGAMELVLDDVAGRRFADWAAWRAWGRDNLLPWFDQVRVLFKRVGVPVTVWLDRRESYEQFLDGFRLTDVLTDLAADLADGDLLLPEEVLDRFPGAERDLTRRRWSSAVAGLVAELSAQARRWVTQPGLARGMHPGPATVLTAMAELLLAQLDAVEAAGPALLRSAPAPSLARRARVYAPARLRSAVAWRLTPLAAPARRTDHHPDHAAGSAAGSAARVPGDPPRAAPRSFRRPPPHPTGARPPRFDADRMPNHVGVIMDGNGRWAQLRGLPRHEGHRAGVAAVHETVYGALEIGLPHLTLYAFSTENWKRDSEEVTAIMRLMGDEMDADPYGELDVRVRWSGRPDKLPADLVETLRQQEAASRTRRGLTLTMCIGYGGRDEITRTAASLARASRAGTLDPGLIDEQAFARHLPYPDMPDVDLLWRTGNEQRTSNFLPWHASYAELYFTPGNWPDVDRRDLWRAVTAYGARQRRHGSAPTPLGVRTHT